MTGVVGPWPTLARVCALANLDNLATELLWRSRFCCRNQDLTVREFVQFLTFAFGENLQDAGHGWIPHTIVA